MRSDLPNPRRTPWASGTAAAALGLALLASSCLEGAVEPERPRPKNVLLIVVDTLRSDHLSSYGHERSTTPAIDALAAGGLRFERSISQAPWTTPSIGALMTSRFPTSLGITTKRAALPDEVETLAEFLQARGFATGAVISHSFCSSRWNFQQGFDSFDESNVLGHDGICSPGVTERALEFLDGHAQEPFFLWLHLFDPHFAYIEHADHPYPGPPDYAGPIKSGMGFSRLMKLDLTQDDVDQVKAYYDSEIAYTDRHVGLILGRLRELGIADETLIVFTADHGEEFKEHGRVGHTKTLYQELLHVPLILSGPGIEPGVVPETVATIDIYPTVLELLGLESDQRLEGRSLLGERGPRPVFSETSRNSDMRSVIAGRWKLIEDLREESLALYDLESDPGELHDLSAERPEELAKLQTVLRAWKRDVAAGGLEGALIELTPEELEHLNELGYTGDDEDEELPAKGRGRGKGKKRTQDEPRSEDP